MTYERRSLLAIGAMGMLALPVAGVAQPAATPTKRIRGAIAKREANALIVRTASGDTVTVAFGPNTRLAGVLQASLSDIKPGDFIGTAARPGPDGQLVALEVHIFPESMRGTGEGHRPFDMGPQSTMTNGTVGTDIANVRDVSGRSMTVRYAGGQQRVLVPAGTPVVRFEPGTDAMLDPGAHVSVTATQTGDGKLRATRIAVGEAGMVPPI